jgi:hypothetical protein
LIILIIFAHYFYDAFLPISQNCCFFSGTNPITGKPLRNDPRDFVFTDSSGAITGTTGSSYEKSPGNGMRSRGDRSTLSNCRANQNNNSLWILKGEKNDFFDFDGILVF